jgi:hypothetical protein
MIHDALRALIIRSPASFDYKLRDNNIKNNMLDLYELFDGENVLIFCHVQTIVNIPGGRFLNTIGPGKFFVKAFVDPRKFYGRIHGIVEAYDLEGQGIDGRSIQPVEGKDGAPIDFERWLEHDTQKHPPAPPMTLCSAAWSAGCIIHHPQDLADIGRIFDRYRVIPGDRIPYELVEVRPH